MSKIPTGLAIIGSLHAFSAMFTTISVILSIPFVIVAFTQDLGLGVLETLDTIWGWLVSGLHGATAIAIFSRKSKAIPIVTFFAGISILFAVLSLITGNMFAIFSIVINVIVIGYMRKSHVKAWLNDSK